MDDLLELLFSFFVEIPVELTMESKRVRPWVKTAVMFLAVNILTVMMIFIALDSYRESRGGSDWYVAAIAAGIFFVISVVVCVVGHRRGWRRERSCPLEKPAEKPARNTPKADMVIRTAYLTDLDAITRVEAECFPAAEAATRAEFEDRLKHYAGHFWLMFDGDKLISFVDGFVTNEPDLTDEMFANAALHNEAGAWQMIFGVNTIPAYRRHGYAGQLIERAIADAREQGRKGVVLTCKPEKVPYYMKFGFVNEGISENSVHGGAVWHQMRLTF